MIQILLKQLQFSSGINGLSLELFFLSRNVWDRISISFWCHWYEKNGQNLVENFIFLLHLINYVLSIMWPRHDDGSINFLQSNLIPSKKKIKAPTITAGQRIASKNCLLQ